MSDKLWVEMAVVFYGKDPETAERMGRGSYFTKAAAKMISVIAEKVEGEERLYLEEQASIANDEERL